MKVLAFDPGKKHFAYAVIDRERCIRYGHIRTVTDLNVESLHAQTVLFFQDLAGVLRNAGSGDWLTFERMQHRPNFGGGAVVEYMNVMIGMLLGQAYAAGLRIYPVAPVTWKSHTIRSHGLDRRTFTMIGQKLAIKQPPGSPTKTKRQFCPGLLDGQPGAEKLTPHEADAVGIGCYCWEQLTGISIVKRVLG